MEEISRTDRVRNEDARHRAKKERIILLKIRIRKANWILYFLRMSCLLKHIIKGKTERETELMES
jgi:hypothetical protein